MRSLRIVVTAGALAVLLLTASGCATLFEKVLPVVARVLTIVQDAEQILNQVDAAARSFFTASPDKEREKQYTKALAKARSALNAATRAAHGLEKLDQQAIDQAFDDFRIAYQEVLSILGPLGLVQEKDDQLLLSAQFEDPVVIPRPLAIGATP
jgi:hypothetical protein